MKNIKTKKNILISLLMGGLILTSSSVAILKTQASKSSQLTPNITNNLGSKNNNLGDDGNTLPEWLNENGKIFSDYLNNNFTVPVLKSISNTLNAIKTPFQNDFKKAFPKTLQNGINKTITDDFVKIIADIAKEQTELVNKLVSILTSFGTGTHNKLTPEQFIDILNIRGINGLIDFLNTDFLNPAKTKIIHQFEDYGYGLKFKIKHQVTEMISNSIGVFNPLVNRNQMIDAIQNHCEGQFNVIKATIDTQVKNFSTILNNFEIPHIGKNAVANLKNVQGLRSTQGIPATIERKIIFTVINKQFMPTVDGLMVSLIKDVVSIFTDQNNPIKIIINQFAQIGVNVIHAGWHIEGVISYDNLKTSFNNFGTNFHNGLLPSIQQIGNDKFYSYLQNFKLV